MKLECVGCNEFQNVCIKQFPNGCVPKEWIRFLTSGKCPLGKWDHASSFLEKRLAVCADCKIKCRVKTWSDCRQKRTLRRKQFACPESKFGAEL